MRSEIPPLGHVPEKMHAWAIRKERHGPPEEAMQIEVVPTWTIGDDEVLVMMAAGVNYNSVWAALGQPFPPSTCTSNPITWRAPTRPASSGRSVPR